MNVNGLSNSSYGVQNVFSQKGNNKTGNVTSDFQNNFQGTCSLVLVSGGLMSRGLSDGGCTTVYKAEGYSAENPLMRVVTTSLNGQEYEQLIDPTKVNPASATRTEIDALTAYLVDEKKLDSVSALGIGAGAGIGTTTFSSASTVKENYCSLTEEMMKMQYNSHNYEGYLHYKKILSIFDALMLKR